MQPGNLDAPSRKELISLIRQNSLSSHVRHSIYALIQSDQFREVLTNLLCSKNLEDRYFKTPIVSNLIRRLSSISPDAISLVLRQEVKFSAPDKGNLYKDLQYFPEAALRDIIGITTIDSGGSNVGPGEIAFSLCYANISNKVDGMGDLMFNKNKYLELKGNAGRFGGQPGRGLSVDFVETDLYREITTTASSETIQDGSDIAQTFLDVKKNIPQYLPALVKLIESLYWNKRSAMKYLGAFEKFTKYEKSEKHAVRRALCLYNTEAYINSIEADYLVLFDKKSGEYVTISAKEVHSSFTSYEKALVDSMGFHKFKDPHLSMKIVR